MWVSWVARWLLIPKENNSHLIPCDRFKSYYPRCESLCINVCFQQSVSSYLYFGPKLEIFHLGWEKVGKPQRMNRGYFWESPERTGACRFHSNVTPVREGILQSQLHTVSIDFSSLALIPCRADPSTKLSLSSKGGFVLRWALQEDEKLSPGSCSFPDVFAQEILC